MYNQQQNEQEETAESNETTSLLHHVAKEVKEESKSNQQTHQIMRNFILFSILFSIHHGTVTACLHLASARLGDIGAWQTGTLYLTYTGSALFGATYVVMTLGARNAATLGMTIYCTYIGCFYLATMATTPPSLVIPICIVGAAIGGIGGGFVWTAQGAYFTRASEEYAASSLDKKSISDANSMLGGIFACIYLLGEVTLNLFSTVSVKVFNLTWSQVYGVYFSLAVMSVLGMMTFVQNFKYDEIDKKHQEQHAFKKATAAAQLFFNDPKMKYMIGLNAAFGFSSAFLNSFVFGEVLTLSSSLKNPSAVVGIFGSVVASVAAIMSIVFGAIACKKGKGFVLNIGAWSFFMVPFLFVIKPNTESWGWFSLLFVSVMMGVGRATFESTLRAVFADFFSHEKEGAFANIIVQSGVSSVVGFWLSVNLPCHHSGMYCIKFRDGGLHNTLAFEVITMVTSLFAIFGFRRAAALYRQEMRVDESTKDVQRINTLAV